MDTDIYVSLLNTGPVDTPVRWKAVEMYMRYVVRAAPHTCTYALLRSRARAALPTPTA
jgi:hypothetical protein